MTYSTSNCTGFKLGKCLLESTDYSLSFAFNSETTEISRRIIYQSLIDEFFEFVSENNNSEKFMLRTVDVTPNKAVSLMSRQSKNGQLYDFLITMDQNYISIRTAPFSDKDLKSAPMNYFVSWFV